MISLHAFHGCQKECTLESTFLLFFKRFQRTLIAGFGLVHDHGVVDEGLKHGHVDYFRHVVSIFGLFCYVL